ncbi:MAG: hypothetical protein OEZ59_11625, partial [Deltaproteobacteria bacterium]|nr:hypothetical protein [Deltaproteobacteria bacterium]
MKKRFLITMLLMLAASLAASLAAGAQPCDGGDTACLEKQVNGHAVRQMRFWEQYFALPIEQRVNVAPKEVVEYINLDNRLQGYPEDTKLADVSGDFLGDVKNAVKGIPGGIANVMKGKLAGVFLVNDLGGTGYTEYISDEKGRRVAGFIVLDAGVLKGRKANEWATWKESTPFAGDKDHKIEVVIERGPDDNRQQAIQYILLHEIGHVISVNETIHPPWGVAP